MGKHFATKGALESRLILFFYQHIPGVFDVPICRPYGALITQ